MVVLIFCSSMRLSCFSVFGDIWYHSMHLNTRICMFLLTTSVEENNRNSQHCENSWKSTKNEDMVIFAMSKRIKRETIKLELSKSRCDWCWLGKKESGENDIHLTQESDRECGSKQKKIYKSPYLSWEIYFKYDDRSITLRINQMCERIPFSTIHTKSSLYCDLNMTRNPAFNDLVSLMVYTNKRSLKALPNKQFITFSLKRIFIFQKKNCNQCKKESVIKKRNSKFSDYNDNHKNNF